MSKNLSNPQRILVINLFGIGDVLFTFPLIRNLKLQFPQASIGYIGNSRTNSLLKDNKDIDQVFVYDRDEYNSVYKRSKLEFIKKGRAFIAKIKQEGYDVVFDFSMSPSFNFFTVLAGIKQRIGFNYKNRSCFLTNKFPLLGFEGKHVVDFYLDILPKMGVSVEERALSISLNPDDDQWAKDLIKNEGFSRESPIIGVVPGAGASWGSEAKYKQWQPEKYMKLVDKMIENLSCQIILMGDGKELDLCEKIAKSTNSKVLQACGKTSVGQLAALLSQCSAVVLNDGGPLHLAVAVGTKTVSIFGPVDAKVYGPFGNSSDHCVVTSDVSCRPCYRRFRMVACAHSRCLHDISADTVFESIKKII
jgi:lipopolysaccharide heptosyltransferase II